MPVAPGTYEYLFVPWDWDTTTIPGEGFWHRPIGGVGSVDMRSIPDQSVEGGTPHGYCFLALDRAASIPAGAIRVGNDLNAKLDDRIGMEQSVGLASGDLAGLTIVDAVFASLTEYSDPTGDNGVKPLMPTVQGNLVLTLGHHSVIKRERFRWGEHAHTAKVRELVRSDFALMKALDIAQGKDDYKRFLDWLSAKYRVPPNDIIPGELTLPRRSIFGDTFVETGGDVSLDAHTPTGPNAGSGWTEFSGTNANVNATEDAVRPIDAGSSGYTYAREDDALSGVDHYAQSTIGDIVFTGANMWSAVMTRKENNSTNTNYAFWAYRNNLDWAIWKRVSGVHTNVDETTANVAPVQGDVLYGESNGNIHTLKVNTVTKLNPTDPVISLGNYCGLMNRADNANDHLDLADWEAADLAVGQTVGTGLLTGLKLQRPRLVE